LNSSGVRAGDLSVAYAEDGPANGPVVLLLHGWPYDIHASPMSRRCWPHAGYRVIIPYLCAAMATTRFRSDATVRNGQPAALATDIIALMDALKIEKAVVGGFDWGARTADIMAALWPERVQGAGLRQRLSDRQPEGQPRRCRRRPSSNGGTSSTSPPSAAGRLRGQPATTSPS
jgi:pimeloyl-ACP methyl ester carboxylesterase